MESRLVALYKTPEEYEILERFKGSALKGKSYLPLFPYFSTVETLLICTIFLFLKSVFSVDERKWSI